jgi:phosphonate transport system permease protein
VRARITRASGDPDPHHRSDARARGNTPQTLPVTMTMKANGFETAAHDRFDELLQRERRGQTALTIQVAVVALAILASLWVTSMFDGERLSEGLPAIGVVGSEMFPPDFTRWEQWITPMIDTIAMSVAGTFLAVAFSVPLAFLAAKNTAPNRTVYSSARMVLNALLSIPKLIMGNIFVAAVGFGMLPGVLALGLHSVGLVGKFFAEAIEHAHPAPSEAALAAGASPLQVIAHGVIPQVFKQFADVTMCRWEYNFRASAVMGMVGAGGIGTELVGSLQLLDYPQVCAILIVILVAVSIVDGLSGILRRRFQ